MKAKEVNYQCNNHEDMPLRKANNWLDCSFSRPNDSKEKKLQTSSSVNNLAKTKERFYNLEHNTKSRLNLSVKENRKVDLSGYMTRMDNARYQRYA
jgi:hypothetical protein